MKTLVFALCATLCFAAPAFAQDATSSGRSAATASGSETGAKGGKIKEAIQACREEMKSKGMTPGSKEMRQAVMGCVGKDHPRMAAIMKCVIEGKEKGLKPKTDEMKSFVKDCQKNGG